MTCRTSARTLRTGPDLVLLKDGPVVPGDGPGETGIVIVGRDPGRIEVLEGKPFVGQAGCLLTRELGYIGINRSGIHITNAVLCHTEGNKKPSVQAVEACQDRLIGSWLYRRGRKVRDPNRKPSDPRSFHLSR